MGGTVTYHQHIHSTDTNDLTVDTADTVATTEGIADDYISDIETGCFTKPYWHIRYSYSYPVTWTCNGGAGSHWDASWGGWRCNRCNAAENDHPQTRTETVTETGDYWTSDENDRPGNRVETKYVRGCGRLQGQIVGISIEY